MCDIVKTDSLLALLLSKKESVSFRQLRLLRNRIVKTNPDVVLDISAPSVDMAVRYYPQVFAVNKAKITRAKDAKQFFESPYIQEEFLSGLRRPVVDQLLSCFKSAH